MRALQSRWLSTVVRVTLGVIFIFSALPKISDPPAFAQMIWNYRIVPSGLVNLLAIILPWIELFAGIALVSGLLRRGAALIVCGMLVVFITAIGTNIVRGNPLDCGCFSVGTVGKTREELMTGMKLDVLRDIGILLMALQAFLTPVNWRAKDPDPIRERSEPRA